MEKMNLFKMQAIAGGIGKNDEELCTKLKELILNSDIEQKTLDGVINIYRKNCM